jgi:hypothetical protein
MYMLIFMSRRCHWRPRLGDKHSVYSYDAKQYKLLTQIQNAHIRRIGKGP